MFVRNAQRTSSQVRRQLVPVLLNTSIDALHEGMQIRLPLHRGQVILEGGLDTLDATGSMLQRHYGTISGVEAFCQREAFAAQHAAYFKQ